MFEAKHVLLPGVSRKKVYLYNTLGSLCGALFYTVLLMVVNRLCGEKESGIFAIGYAIALLMYTIGSFETGTYQATDAKSIFSFGHYFALKLILCIVMMIISFGVVAVRGGTRHECAVILLLCLFKTLDAFSGVFYFQFQKYGRLDISGKSLCIRMLLSMVVLSLALLFGKNLTTAIALACVCEAVWIAMYEMRLMAPLYGLRPCFEWNRLGKLALECLPLFLGAFMVAFLINLPKYTIDAYYSMEVQAAFSVLFIPAAVINLLSMFVFRPALTQMSKIWVLGEMRDFTNLINRFVTIISGLTLLAMGFAWIAGIQALSLVYGVELQQYRIALVVIMLGGGFSALTTFLNQILIVMRKQKSVLVGDVVSASISLCLCVPLVKNGGMLGATCLYAVSMVLAALPMMIAVSRTIRMRQMD